MLIDKRRSGIDRENVESTGTEEIKARLVWRTTTPEHGSDCGLLLLETDYDQRDEVDGLPLGLVYDRHGLVAGVSRRFKHGLSASLQYAF